MTTPDDDGDVFEPSSEGASASSSLPNEGSNVCRAATLAFLLRGARPAMSGLAPELSALGFSNLVLQDGSRDWAGRDPLRGPLGFTIGLDANLDLTRTRRWAEMNENADVAGAVDFLLAMLGSSLERESAAAAAALWRGLTFANRLSPPSISPRLELLYRLLFDLEVGFGKRDYWPLRPPEVGGPPFSDFDAEEAQPWEPDRWIDAYQRLSHQLRLSEPYMAESVIAALAFARLDQAIRSTDAITRSLAIAALVPDDGSDGARSEPGLLPPSSTAPAQATVSTMIHGTRAFMGEWWRPRVGDFHRFIGTEYRPNLYSGGAHFHWSGAYRARHRARASEFFAEWVTDRAPGGIQSVFAHSYGGEVAARALNLGTPIRELVFLSTPVTKHVEAAARVGVRVVDIRLPFDPVLALELRPQRIDAQENVAEVLTSWRLDHGATHKESVWVSDDIARKGQISLEPGLIRR